MSVKMLKFCLAITATLLINVSETSVVENQLPDQFNNNNLLPETLTDILIKKNLVEATVKPENIAVATKNVLTAFEGIFTELIIPVLNFIEGVWIANLVSLFATLNGTTYLWAYPNIYFPILAIYVVLLIISGVLYLISNAFSDDPDSFGEILSTFWNNYILAFVWSFYPF
ncbi:uncharacterized protein LOC109543174 isoform X1 [Dendroctonus ponderosae]|uniref:MARVEL domain-containing protein n=1 Tax=Dendroctonus ponderosae TaxID=77166 RepID=A0AAR5Q518_DENPD|nr:uncharacterized protein LOC109543174 isoform X1 [Dendroctonus ponderosae]